MLKTRLLLVLLPLLLTLGGCDNKDDDPDNPVDALPPITQSGAQTLGCLIDGEPFVPDSFGSGRPSAFYQFVDGAFTLGMSGSSRNGGSLTSIDVGALDIESLNEGTFLLKTRNSGSFDGEYRLGGGIDEQAGTTDTNPGTLTITRFDQEVGIISGVFEFTAVG
ncbi:MAG: hypothetical protein AAGF77_10785, partial [Bacteroidota bacterium]